MCNSYVVLLSSNKLILLYILLPLAHLDTPALLNSPCMRNGAYNLDSPRNLAAGC